MSIVVSRALFPLGWCVSIFFFKLRHPRGEEVTTLSRAIMSALSHETVVQNQKKMAAKAQKLFHLLDINDDRSLVRVWV